MPMDELVNDVTDAVVTYSDEQWDAFHFGYNAAVRVLTESIFEATEGRVASGHLLDAGRERLRLVREDAALRWEPNEKISEAAITRRVSALLNTHPTVRRAVEDHPKDVGAQFYTAVKGLAQEVVGLLR